MKSNAKFCDRCGNLIDPNHIHRIFINLSGTFINKHYDHDCYKVREKQLIELDL